MFGYRQASVCSALIPDVSEIMALAKIPKVLRPQRVRTHSEPYAHKLLEKSAFFCEWALSEGEQPVPADPAAVLRFTKNNRENLGMGIPATLEYVNAIGALHRAHDLEPPRSRDLVMYCSMLRKEHVIQSATPFSTDDVMALCSAAALEMPNRAARDIALFLLGFAGALRPIEEAAIRFDDLDIRPGGVRITIPTSKNNYKKPRRVTIGRGMFAFSDPVAALLRWLEAGKITDGYVFRKIERNDRVHEGLMPLTHTTLNKILRRYARTLNLKGRISWYSFRRGCATTAAANGVSVDVLRDHLRHELRRTTEGYVLRQPVPFEQSVTALVLP